MWGLWIHRSELIYDHWHLLVSQAFFVPSLGREDSSFSSHVRLSLLTWKSVANIELSRGVNNGFFPSSVSEYIDAYG